MNRWSNVFLGLVMALGLGACVREKLPDCPPMQVTLSVKDKNYFNIDDAAKLGLLERKAEDLPFRSYVSSLYYIVHDADGNVVAEQKNTVIDNDDLVQQIVLPSSLPYGTYSFTVWGNMKSDEPLGENATEADIEEVGAAFNDIYLANGTFEYQYGKEKHTLGLERTKGNLLIKAENIPDNIDFSTKDIMDVFSLVDNSFNYSNLTDLHTNLDWEVHNEILTQTLVGPSPGYEDSALDVEFIEKGTSSQGDVRNASSSASLVPERVYCTFGRNELTILRYVYVGDGSSNEFKVYIMVNAAWEQVIDMDIQE